MHKVEEVKAKRSVGFDSKPGITLVLADGDDVVLQIKKAQQQAAELQKTLQSLIDYEPTFHLL